MQQPQETSSRKMQGVASSFNISSHISTSPHLSHQIPNSQVEFQHQQQQQRSSHFEHFPHDEFFNQMMISDLPSSSPWPDLSSNPSNSSLLSLLSQPSSKLRDSSADGGLQFPYDASSLLASSVCQNQINGSHQLVLHSQRSSGGGIARTPSVAGLLPLPLSLCSSESSGSVAEEDTVQARYSDGSVGSLPPTAQTKSHQKFLHRPQTDKMTSMNCGAPAAAANQAPAKVPPPPAPTRQRVRARRGQATDPHSIAERVRRERIAERMKALQELVPYANKTDKATMLDEIIDYVKFLRLQVKVLRMSRLGGAAAVAPLVAEMTSEACGNGARTASTDDSLSATEQQVAKLMEEDIGSALQCLQGKGLCLMPISLASALFSAASSHRSPHTLPPFPRPPDSPPSPNISVLTVQSAPATAGGGDTAPSISTP